MSKKEMNVPKLGIIKKPKQTQMKQKQLGWKRWSGLAEDQAYLSEGRLVGKRGLPERIIATNWAIADGGRLSSINARAAAISVSGWLGAAVAAWAEDDEDAEDDDEDAEDDDEDAEDDDVAGAPFVIARTDSIAWSISSSVP